MKIKWYETFDYKTGKKFWWTQRDKEGKCFEIRKNETNGLILNVNELFFDCFESLIDAQKVASKIWVI